MSLDKRRHCTLIPSFLRHVDPYVMHCNIKCTLFRPSWGAGRDYVAHGLPLWAALVLDLHTAHLATTCQEGFAVLGYHEVGPSRYLNIVSNDIISIVQQFFWIRKNTATTKNDVMCLSSWQVAAQLACPWHVHKRRLMAARELSVSAAIYLAC